MSETYESIKTWTSHDDTVAHVQLNKPKANVLDAAMMAELSQAFTVIGDNKQTKLVVIQAEGPHFSFGASVSEHVKEAAPAMLTQFHALFGQMMELSIPFLAAVQGQCLGGGFELAMFCHFLIAEDSANFAVPEVKLGVFPPPASVILPLRIGQARTEDLVLTGRNAGAQEMKDAGLVNMVVAKGELLTAIDGFIAEHIMPKSASSLRHATKAVRWIFDAQLRSQCETLQDYYVNQLMETHDANEGIAAFLEKREPEWKHE